MPRSSVCERRVSSREGCWRLVQLVILSSIIERKGWNLPPSCVAHSVSILLAPAVLPLAPCKACSLGVFALVAPPSFLLPHYSPVPPPHPHRFGKGVPREVASPCCPGCVAAELASILSFPFSTWQLIVSSESTRWGWGGCPWSLLHLHQGQRPGGGRHSVDTAGMGIRFLR